MFLLASEGQERPAVAAWTVSRSCSSSRLNRMLQARPAAAALRWRISLFAAGWVRVPRQAFPGVPGLPAPAAVLPAVPLRFLPPCPARLLRPDPLPRAGRPRVGAAHPQPALQLSDPQLHPPSQLPLSVQLLPQHRDLSVFRLHHGTQPHQELTMLGDHASQIRLTSHEPQHAHPGLKVQIPAHDVSGRPPAANLSRLAGTGGHRSVITLAVIKAAASEAR
jgi:hypothetical protein